MDSWLNKCTCVTCAFKFKQKMAGFSLDSEKEIDEEYRIICGLATSIISDINLYITECDQYKTPEDIMQMQQAQIQARTGVSQKTTPSGIHLV